MSWRFRKIFQSGPFRWTWTKKGVGWSWGIPGFRYGVSPTGQHYISIGIPGTGLYFIKYLGKRKAVSQDKNMSISEVPLSEKPQTESKTTEPWWKQKNLSD